MLVEAREQITDLRNADARIAGDASKYYLELEKRLGTLEGRVFPP